MNRTIRRWVQGPFVAVAAVAILVIVSPVVSQLDPTEQGFAIALKNDSSSFLIAKQCSSRCDRFHEIDHLRPDESVPVNVSDDNRTNWWQVVTANGSVLGCLQLKFDHKAKGVVVSISAASVACP